MASYVRLPECSGSASEWDVFAEQLSFYFTANGITDAGKQRAILLSACGTTTYKLLKTLVAPAELTSKSTSGEHTHPLEDLQCGGIVEEVEVVQGWALVSNSRANAQPTELILEPQRPSTVFMFRNCPT